MPDDEETDEQAQESEQAELQTELRLLAAGGQARLTATGWSPFGAGGPRRCTFCGRREESVQHLICSRDAYICEACVTLAADSIAAAPPEQKLLRIRLRAQGPGDRDAAEEEVARAFETVIGGDALEDERMDLIEGGSNLQGAFREVAERLPAPQRPDAFVEHVRFLGEDEAEVQFVLVFHGAVPPGRLPETGHAVMSDGRWKVARETWCRLVGRIGVTCPPME